MLFTDFATRLHKLENISSRLAITAELADLYQHLEVTEVKVATYLLLGELAPAYQGVTFQLSTKMVLRALARWGGGTTTAPSLFAELSDSAANASSVTEQPDQLKHVSQLYRKMGDLGLVAEYLVGSSSSDFASDSTSGSNPGSSPQPKPNALSIQQVYDELMAIAQAGGEGSQEQKVALLDHLLHQLKTSAAAVKTVVRIVLGRVRLGFSDMTVLDALSWAVTGDKSDNELLEEAWQKQADIGVLAEAYLRAARVNLQQDLQPGRFTSPELAQTSPGQKNYSGNHHPTSTQRHQLLATYSVQVGVPVIPALCQRLNNAQEVVEKMGQVIVEPKYDGLRVQIHFRRQSGSQPQLIKTFTRNLEDNSHQFPELQQLPQLLSCESCILDTEAIGFNPQTGKLLPFQETITRKRKHDIGTRALSLPLRFYVFDVLSLNGDSLIDKKLQERKDVLKKLFKKNEVLEITKSITSSDPKQIQSYHEQTLAEGLEGVVIKQLDSNYQSGRKGWQWVKMKEAAGTRGKLTDTIDGVVMGYYLGRGKRTAFGLGALLIGVQGDGDQILTVAKVGTGLTEEQLKSLSLTLKPYQVLEQPPQYQVNKGLVPDVWVKPHLVLEVAADEITRSPIHTAGWALRFPRLIKVRDDKSWQQSTTLKEFGGLSG